jgi:hypothetical protein
VVPQFSINSFQNSESSFSQHLQIYKSTLLRTHKPIKNTAIHEFGPHGHEFKQFYSMMVSLLRCMKKWCHMEVLYHISIELIFNRYIISLAVKHNISLLNLSKYFCNIQYLKLCFEEKNIQVARQSMGRTAYEG